MSNKFSSATTRQEVLGELAGAASSCWSDIADAGVFDSGLAEFFVGEAMTRLEELDAEAWPGQTQQVEEILLNTDQAIRVQALDMAVHSAVPGFADEKPVIERARYFEQYIKNGAFENANEA